RSVWTSRRLWGLSIVAAGLFMSWKEGVVRADPGHLVVVLGYAALTPVLLSAVPRERDWGLRPLRSSFFALSVLTCLGAIQSLRREDPRRFATLARTWEGTAHSLDLLFHPRSHL